MKKSLLFVFAFTGVSTGIGFAAEPSFIAIDMPSNQSLEKRIQVRKGITKKDLKNGPIKGFFSEMRRAPGLFPFQLCSQCRSGRVSDISDFYLDRYLLNEALLLDGRPLGESNDSLIERALRGYKLNNMIEIKRMSSHDLRYKKENYKEVSLCVGIACCLAGFRTAISCCPSVCCFASALSCGCCSACSVCSLGFVWSELQNVTVEAGSLCLPEMRE